MAEGSDNKERCDIGGDNVCFSTMVAAVGGKNEQRCNVRGDGV